ncbi:hypothetical protein BRC83_01980 [Halobacteriales archaeon QS_1_68_17]|nr:MAG: hypothetical protein BRC83_01980 [Halobacteriales archaeon QS_1_68_17]
MSGDETRWRANYVLTDFGEHLGGDDDLDVPWAEFVGDRTSVETFAVRATETADAYVELQAFDVGEYGHEVLVNDESLSGFDLPPADGWQYWMDRIPDGRLREGENALRIERDATTDDAFVVGTATVHWREPVE